MCGKGELKRKKLFEREGVSNHSIRKITLLLHRWSFFIASAWHLSSWINCARSSTSPSINNLYIIIITGLSILNILLLFPFSGGHHPNSVLVYPLLSGIARMLQCSFIETLHSEQNTFIVCFHWTLSRVSSESTQTSAAYSHCISPSTAPNLHYHPTYETQKCNSDQESGSQSHPPSPHSSDWWCCCVAFGCVFPIKRVLTSLTILEFKWETT